MCGIAGIVSFEGPVSPDVLGEMNDRLVHRGPDDGGVWLSADGRVGLANRRLAIIDLSSAGHQPMASPDRQCWLAFNGELYNYRELRREMAAHGQIFLTETDTEVVLAAYREWGEHCVERFNGMFAFALWDARRRVLFVARDRFGEKPFYYARLNNRLLFASEIKSILADPDVPRRVDELTVSRYLVLALVDVDERTFLADVRQLPAAHTMTIEADGRTALRRYWQVDLNADSGCRDVREAGARFRELFRDAIDIRLRSDVPVGSSLSGGLDSTSIVCTMRSLLAAHPTTTQQTFSARYPDASIDEGRYIDAVAHETGVDAHHVWITGDDLLADLHRFLWHQDEPVAHTSQFAQWKVMKLARDSGVTVLLDGQGADEIIGGYPAPTFGYRYADLVQRGRMLELLSELRDYRHHHGHVATALRYMVSALVPIAAKNTVRRRVRRTSDLGPVPSVPTAAAEAREPLRAALYQVLTITSLPSLLRYGDRNSMAFSRETRLPFLDHRLVEFAYSLRPDLLVRRGATKVVLREAMKDIVPELVRTRIDKIGFATPEREWFLGPLRSCLEGALSDAKRRGVVPPNAIERQWRTFVAGGGSGTIWRLANFEFWMQQFIDGRPVSFAAA